MRPIRSLFVFVCVGVVAAPTSSCVDATEIDLQITTNEPAAQIVAPQRARVIVGAAVDGGLGTTTLDVQTNVVDPNGAFGDLVVGPNGDINADVAVRVVLGVGIPTDQCDDATLTNCIAASRTLPYLPHHKLVLPIELDSACVGVVCAAGTTCTGGTCVNDSIVPTSCDGGTCGLGDASVAGGDAGKADATVIEAGSTLCGGVDCSGGTCSAGTCRLGQTAATTPAACVGLWNGSVYVATQSFLYDVPIGGGTLVSTGPVNGAVVDLTTLGEGADLAYLYMDGSVWDVVDKAQDQTGVPIGSNDRIAVDTSGVAALSFTSGQVSYTPFAGTALPWTKSIGTSYQGAWLTVGEGGAYVFVSTGAQLFRVTSTAYAALNAQTNPALVAPTGVALSDPTSPSSTVYVVENGSAVVSFDTQLAQKSSFAGGGTAMQALVWDNASGTAYAISSSTIYKSENGTMIPLVQAPNAASRCIAVDATSVYWVDTLGGVFKHAK